MNYQQLVIIVPCHSLEDFPVHHQGDDAAGLLAGWTALWHPRLIASAQSLLEWQRMDDPPEELEGRLLVIPSVSAQDLPTGFIDRARDSGATVVANESDRCALIEAALAGLPPAAAIDQELVADFLALGYCHLQIELLTRQMRYASNLDEIHFQNLAVAAANAAVEGELDTARQKITACFDLLGQERDHYYAVDAYLLDVTMLAPSTLGSMLSDQLASQTPQNLLASSQLIEQLASQHPDNFAAVRQGVDGQQLALIGGAVSERAWPLLPLEQLLEEIQQGRESYQQQLGYVPSVFGRYSYGLTPVLPQLLVKSGYQGAFHATFEEGSFPEGSQVKTRWEGVDATSLDAIARVPLNANLPETFLSLATKLGESMDMDHVATLCLAHWPGQISPWYGDLQRVARQTAALGRFMTVDKYFEATDLPGINDRLDADQYSSPYLKQAIIRQQPDPISRCVKYWSCFHNLQQLESLRFLSRLLGQPAAGECSLHEKLAGTRLFDPVGADDQNGETVSGQLQELDEQIQQASQQALESVAAGIPRSDLASRAGYLAINPHSFARRFHCQVNQLDNLPAIEKPIYAVSQQQHDDTTERQVVCDVPSMGFAWIDAEQASSAPREDQPMAEDNVLRNDFFQVLVHPTSGGIQSIGEYGSRGNRLSQQLSYREPRRRKPGAAWEDSDELANYSSMLAESVEISQLTATVGEITSRGRLQNAAGDAVADFEQKMRVVRGSRVLELEIHLEPHVELKGDPWNSYFTSRFAWSDESARIFRDVNQTRQPAVAKRLEAPGYLDIQEDDWRTTILTAGLPFHRRIGFRMIDSLLIVRGETCQDFKLGIGIDLTHSLPQASSWLTTPPLLFQQAAPPAGNSTSWLFNLDARNVVATSWQPLLEEGEPVGFTVRLLETAGRAGKVSVGAFRNVAAADQRDFKGESLGPCRIEEGRAVVEMAAAEWLEVEIRWDD
jgi:alpha-mannosidase